MKVNDLFISYGPGTDKNKQALKFYELMNSKVYFPSKSSVHRNYMNHRIGADAVFNFCGSLEKYLNIGDDLTLLALSMCYTTLNKSFLSGVGKGRNMNCFKNLHKNSQGFDRPDKMSAMFDEHYSSEKGASSLIKVLNEKTIEFINEFSNIYEFNEEVYNIGAQISKNEHIELVRTFL